jgi:hypothetical protein
MASLFIGLNRGAQDQGPDEVTVGTSTGSTDVELRMDETKSLTRMDILLITEALLRYINDGRLDTAFPL